MMLRYVYISLFLVVSVHQSTSQFYDIFSALQPIWKQTRSDSYSENTTKRPKTHQRIEDSRRNLYNYEGNERPDDSRRHLYNYEENERTEDSRKNLNNYERNERTESTKRKLNNYEGNERTEDSRRNLYNYEENKRSEESRRNQYYNDERQRLKTTSPAIFFSDFTTTKPKKTSQKNYNDSRERHTTTTPRKTTRSTTTTRPRTIKPKNRNDEIVFNDDRFNTRHTTNNPLINRPGVRPAVANGPPITNRPPVRDSDAVSPELIIGPNEDYMSEIEKRRYIEVAERMCEKYKAMDVKQLQVIPLVPSPSPININVSTCVPSEVPLVVGGKVVKIQEFPHMALLGWNRLQSSGYSWKCGGSLVSDQHVLTAAHCTYQDRDNSLVTGPPRVVQLGSSYINDPGAQVFKITSVTRHAKYKLPRSYYDIAIVKLAKTVTFSHSIRPACLGAPPPTGDPIIATGWGRTEFGGDQSLELRSVSIPIWSMSECREVLGTSRKIPAGPSSDSQLCAGEKRGGKDTCQGDSGGPAQIQDGCTWRVVAVTSLGRSCGAARTPAIYALVHQPFISAVVFGQTRNKNENSQNTKINFDINNRNGNQNMGHNYNNQNDDYNNRGRPFSDDYNNDKRYPESQNDGGASRNNDNYESKKQTTRTESYYTYQNSNNDNSYNSDAYNNHQESTQSIHNNNQNSKRNNLGNRDSNNRNNNFDSQANRYNNGYQSDDSVLYPSYSASGHSQNNANNGFNNGQHTNVNYNYNQNGNKPYYNNERVWWT